jgi:putative addiction module component (TIGR02574 family)
MKLQEVRESALALPLRSRKKLAQELADSVVSEEEWEDCFPSESIATEWKEEIKRRMDAYARREVKTVPGEKVMAWLRKRMK